MPAYHVVGDHPDGTIYLEIDIYPLVVEVSLLGCQPDRNRCCGRHADEAQSLLFGDSLLCGECKQVSKERRGQHRYEDCWPDHDCGSRSWSVDGIPAATRTQRAISVLSRTNPGSSFVVI